MKKNAFLFFFVFIYQVVYSQCLIPGGKMDTVFPVTNKYNSGDNNDSRVVNTTGASVFSIASGKGMYYVLGDFTSLVANQGSAFVMDSATNKIQNAQKWKINGFVSSAVPDGNGGYYIGGSFTKIGDTTRNFLAQVDSSGQPTSWNLSVNNAVSVLYKKNDTLFIAGAFSQVAARTRYCLALYSISGDTLIGRAGTHPGMSSLTRINSFVIQQDTLIYGGRGSGTLRKYNYKSDSILPWRSAIYEDVSVNFLQFNRDSSALVYFHDYNGQVITCADNKKGTIRYSINISNSYPSIADGGAILGMKVLRDKAYVVGNFEVVLPRTGIFLRKGFFSFDIATGAVTGDDLHLNGFPTFLDIIGGKMFLSGKFTQVNSVGRENFAVLDTGSLAVGGWQLSPSDAIATLAFSGSTAFVAGYFNGITSIHRNGFAAVDSATGAVSYWTADNTLFEEGKRMFIKGDTLFVLGITGRPSSCMVDDFTTAFRIYSLTTGARLTAMGSYSRMDDFIIDGNYLYASMDRQLRRYSLPGLIRDETWGVNYAGAGSDHSPVHLIATVDKIYSVGDNRFIQPCTNLVERQGWFIVYDKKTGYPTNFYSYKGTDPEYDQICFTHALLANDKLYIQGYFSNLNGKPRRNFVCVNVNTGSITDWNPVFTQSGLNAAATHSTSDLKLFNGKIWFGSAAGSNANNTVRFGGIGALDTLTGDLMPPLINCVKLPSVYGFLTTAYLKGINVNDFLFTDRNLVIAGDFDMVNNTMASNLARFALTNGTAPASTGSGISGNSTVYAGTDQYPFYIPGADRTNNTYHWRYTGTGVEIISNGSDTVWLRASDSSATNGQLEVYAINYCGKAPVISKAINIVVPPRPSQPLLLNVSDKCYYSSTARARLVNPPVAGSKITVTLDGTTLAYQPSDSSFQYFIGGVTSIRKHTVSVLYENIRGSTRNDSSFTVLPPVTPLVSISASALSVCSGTTVVFTAVPVSPGSAPVYQWQLNGVNTGNNSTTFSSGNFQNNDQVKFVLNSNAFCATNSSTASNLITLSVGRSFKPIGKAAGPDRVCVNSPFTIIYQPVNTPVGSTVEFWESMDAQGFAARSAQLYNGTPLGFVRPGIGKNSLYRSFFLITPPAGSCGSPASSDTLLTMVEQLGIPSIFFQGNELIVTNPDPAAIYRWQVKGTADVWNDITPAVIALLFTPSSAGTYRLRADKGQCIAYSNEATVRPGQQPAASVGVVLIPNPTTGVLKIDSLQLTDEWITLEIMSYDGKQQLAVFNIENQTSVIIRIDELRNGLYLAVFKRRKGPSLAKLFIKI